MTLALYYHIPISSQNGKLYLPGYLAVFVNALADKVESLILFFHEEQIGNLDSYIELSEKNIIWINIGKKTPAWHRAIFHRQILRKFLLNIQGVDILLVRAPSPLAPYLSKLKGITKIAYYVVGDYKEGIESIKTVSLRDLAVKYFTLWNHNTFMRVLKNSLIIVNSHKQFKKLASLTNQIYEVKTTTLYFKDLYRRKDSFQKNSPYVVITYTGRIVPDKGLNDILESCRILISKGYRIEFQIAGILVDGFGSYIKQLEEKAERLQGLVFRFLGMKKVGDELNQVYRNSNIYILASTSDFEGFPRTIWEAMANSCPVITTNVGSIPYYLEHEKNALLVEPNNPSGIAESVIRLIEDDILRKRIIHNGFELSKNNTLENQTIKLLEILKNHLI